MFILKFRTNIPEFEENPHRFVFETLKAVSSMYGLSRIYKNPPKGKITRWNNCNPRRIGFWKVTKKDINRHEKRRAA